MKKTLIRVFIISVSLCTLFVRSGNAQTAPSIDGGSKWAFCIGIGDYNDPIIRDLPKSRNDAAGLAHALKERGGFDRVFLLSDELNEKDPLFPTRKNIQALFNRYSEVIAPNDLVFVSFSGHGITGPLGRSFLAAWDTRPDYLVKTALPLDDILDFIGKTGVKRSVLFLDAAREKIIKTETQPFHGIYPDRYLRRGVTAVFYAARKGLYSLDYEDSGYGLFSNYLIRGFSGEADASAAGNGDGVVSLRELGAFVRESLALWSIENAVNQTPYIKILAGGMGEMPLTVAGPGRPEGQVLAGAPSEKAAPAPLAEKKEEVVEEKVTTPVPVIGEEAKKERQPEAGEDVVVAAPAPTMKEIMEKQETPPSPTETVQAPPEPTIEAESEETVKPQERVQEETAPVVAMTEGPEKTTPVARVEPAVAPPAPTLEEVEAEKEESGEAALEPEQAPETPEEKPVASQPEEVEREELGPETAALPGPREEEPAEEPRPSPEMAEEETPKVAAIPPEVLEPKPVTLRAESQILSTEDVRVMLEKKNFYATCWNYNGDFCNPEGDFQNRILDNQNGTVTDRATGLMWQQSGSANPMSWQDAKAYAEIANRESFGGYSDWRLPTVEELCSLMERSWQNSDLFIDPAFDKAQRYCWSGDTKDMKTAWKANFHMGFVIHFPMTSQNSVRLVRTHSKE